MQTMVWLEVELQNLEFYSRPTILTKTELNYKRICNKEKKEKNGVHFSEVFRTFIKLTLDGHS